MSSANLRHNASTPATPSPGSSTLYLDNSGVLRLLNSSGVSSVVGGPGGGGPAATTNYQWVDVNHIGTELGTEAEPYSTIQAAVDALAAGASGVIVIKSPGSGSAYAAAEDVTVSGKHVVFYPQGVVKLTGTITAEATGANGASVVFCGFEAVAEIESNDTGSAANLVYIAVQGGGQGNPNSLLQGMTVVTAITESRATGITYVDLHAAMVSALTAVNAGSALRSARRSRLTAVNVQDLGGIHDCQIVGALTYRGLWAPGAGFGFPGGGGGLWGTSVLGVTTPSVVTYAGSVPSSRQFLPCSPEVVETLALNPARASFVDCTLAPTRGPRSNRFGEGTDSTVILSAGTTTLSRTMHYESLTIPAGATLKPAGFRVFVRGLLTIEGAVVANGGDAALQFGGVGGGWVDRPVAHDSQPTDTYVGGKGALAGTSADEAGDTAHGTLGYLGGVGGQGGDHSTAGAGGAAHAFPVRIYPTPEAVPAPVLRQDQTWAPVFAGGGGGGGGGETGSGSGGGGGGGGGSIVFIARQVRLTGSPSLSAVGGDGADGVDTNCGGGGGGGGGLVLVVADSILGDIEAVSDVSAGAGGAGNGAGDAGTVGQDGRVYVRLMGGR